MCSDALLQRQAARKHAAPARQLQTLAEMGGVAGLLRAELESYLIYINATAKTIRMF